MKKDKETWEEFEARQPRTKDGRLRYTSKPPKEPYVYAPHVPHKFKTQKTPRQVKTQSSLNHTKYLNKQEIDNMDRILKKCHHKDTRNVIMFYLALYTGARAGEILNLRSDDFNPTSGSILLRTLKGGNFREIPVAKWLYKELKALTPDDEGYLFPISYQRLNQIWHSYRPCRKPFHSLRHTFAINLYARTKDLRMVQIALGHKDIKNTLIYSEYYYTSNQLRKGIVTKTWEWF